MRQRLSAAGVACPTWAAARDLADVKAFAAAVGGPFVAKLPRSGYDGKGVRVVEAPEDLADWLEGRARRAGRLGAARRRHTAGGAGALRARAGRARRAQPQRAGRGVAGRRDRADRRHLHRRHRPRPGPGPGNRGRGDPRRPADRRGARGDRRAGRRDVPGPPGRRPPQPPTWSTSWRCVRTTAAIGPSTGRRPASSSSICGRCSTCRSATPGPNARGRSWPTCWAANTRTSTRHTGTSWPATPAAKVHLYGKGVRPGRKLGHVSVSGADLADCRARARHAADYLQGAIDE